MQWEDDDEVFGGARTNVWQARAHRPPVCTQAPPAHTVLPPSARGMHGDGSPTLRIHPLAQLLHACPMRAQSPNSCTYIMRERKQEKRGKKEQNIERSEERTNRKKRKREKERKNTIADHKENHCCDTEGAVLRSQCIRARTPSPRKPQPRNLFST